MIEMPPDVVASMGDHARDAYPEECCGFLIGRVSEPRQVVVARRARNVATEDRRRRYVVDPLELLQADRDASREGLDLLGIYHSHPDHPAAPSEFDTSRATTWFTYVILRVVDRIPMELTAWRFDEQLEAFTPEEVSHSRKPKDGPPPRT